MDFTKMCERLNDEDKDNLLRYYNHLSKVMQTQILENIDLLVSQNKTYIIPCYESTSHVINPFVQLDNALTAHNCKIQYVSRTMFDFITERRGMIVCGGDIKDLMAYIGNDGTISGIFEKTEFVYKSDLTIRNGMYECIKELENLLRIVNCYDLETYAVLLQTYGVIFETLRKIKSMYEMDNPISSRIMEYSAIFLRKLSREYDFSYCGKDQYIEAVQYELLYKSAYLLDEDLDELVSEHMLFIAQILEAHGMCTLTLYKSISKESNPKFLENVKRFDLAKDLSNVNLTYPIPKPTSYEVKLAKIVRQITPELIVELIRIKTGIEMSTDKISFNIPENMVTMCVSEYSRKVEIVTISDTAYRIIIRCEQFSKNPYVLFTISDVPNKVYGYSVQMSTREMRTIDIIEISKRADVNYIFHY